MSNPAVKTKAPKKSIVRPTVTFQNDTKEHAMEAILNKEAPPVVKSVGVFKLPNTNQYVSFYMETQGDKVIKIEVEQPNLKAIAEESAKISFVNTFMSGDIDG